MTKLVCIDVDGTLLGSDNTVHPDVWKAAERARAKGIRLALASGRPAFGITRDYAKRLDPTGWHLFQNGASVVNVATGEAASSPLNAEAVTHLIGVARASGRTLELYSDDDYVVEGTGPWPRDHANLLGLPYVERRFESLRGAPVRAQWLVAHSEVAKVAGEAVANIELTPSVSPVMADTAFLVMTATGVNKGSGIRVIAEHYGFAIEDTMAIGDAANDIPAFRVVGMPVAMGNASDEVKALAGHVVGHVDHGGLVEALDWASAASGRGK